MKLKGIISFLRGWSVNVEFWNDSVISHKAISYSDALQWASCYPSDTVVTIRQWGKRVAMVGQR